MIHLIFKQNPNSILVFVILFTISLSINNYQFSYWEQGLTSEYVWMGILSGDEPHYLSLTSNIYRNHSIYLEDFFLSPNPDPELTFPSGYYEQTSSKYWHILKRGEHYIPIHGIGLSLILIPGYAIGGIFGTMLMMSILYSFLGVAIYKTSNLFTTQRTSFITSIAFSVCTILLTFSGRIYTELVVGLLLILAIYLFHRNYNVRNGLIIGLFFGFMLFLKSIYIVFPIILLPSMIILLIKKNQFREIFVLIGTFIIFLLSLILYNYFTAGESMLLGSQSNYFASKFSEISFYNYLNNFMTGLTFNSFGTDNGLFIFSPLVLLSLFGILIFWSKEKSSAIIFLTPFFLFLIIHSWIHVYGSGWSMPSRYLIPIIPISAVFFSLLFEKYQKNLLFLGSFFILAFIGLGFNLKWIGIINAHVTRLSREQFTSEIYHGFADILPSYSNSQNVFYFFDKIPLFFWIFFGIILSLFVVFFLRIFKNDSQQQFRKLTEKKYVYSIIFAAILIIGISTVVLTNDLLLEIKIKSSYNEILNRDATIREINFYKDQIKQGKSFEWIEENLLNYDEYISVETESKINELYLKILQRKADPGGMEHYKKLIIEKGKTFEWLEKELRYSKEYRERFG